MSEISLPMTTMPPGTDGTEVYRRLLGYLRPHWVWFALAVVGYAIEAGATAMFVELLDATIDAIESRNPEARWMLPGAMVALVVARGIGIFAGGYLLARISLAIVHRMRVELFEHLLCAPRDSFDRAARGHITSRITFTVAQLREAATSALRTLGEEGFMVAGLLIYLFWKNWQLTLAFVAVAPLIAVIVQYTSMRFRRISTRIQRSMGDVTQVAHESVGGMDVVRIYGGEDYERRRFERASQRNRSQQLKMVATKHLSTQLIQIIVSLALAFLIWLVLGFTNLDAGSVVAFVTAAALIARPIRKLSEINATVQRGLAAAADVFAELDAPTEPDTGTLPLERVDSVEFDRVRFVYPGSSSPVLDEVSFELHPGRRIALVGASGGGKSTVALLLGRFYTPSGGSIRFNGIDIGQYELASVRAQIALVSQHVTLFNDSVRNNIAYGRLADVGDAAIWRALEVADAAEFVRELPQGLDSVLGEGGMTLSGGQRQRLAIARGVLSPAPLVILDEATSALDQRTELRVLEHLREALAGRATLIIAHRLSTVRDADEILLLEGGRVAERGTHADLMRAQGSYARLHASPER